jgi:hypothetical protein
VLKSFPPPFARPANTPASPLPTKWPRAPSRALCYAVLASACSGWRTISECDVPTGAAGGGISTHGSCGSETRRCGGACDHARRASPHQLAFLAHHGDVPVGAVRPEISSQPSLAVPRDTGCTADPVLRPNAGSDRLPRPNSGSEALLRSGSMSIPSLCSSSGRRAAALILDPARHLRRALAAHVPTMRREPVGSRRNRWCG